MEQRNYIARTSGLRGKDYVGYALVDTAGCLIFSLVTTLLQKYYTDILHLGPLFIMLMFMGARIWDAINDPIMGGADGDHDAVGAVVAQMVVHRGALDAAQVAGEDGGVVGVPLGEGLGVDAPEVQPADDPHDGDQQEPWQGRELVQHLVDAAGSVLALAGLLHVPAAPVPAPDRR